MVCDASSNTVTLLVTGGMITGAFDAWQRVTNATSASSAAVTPNASHAQLAHTDRSPTTTRNSVGTA